VFSHSHKKGASFCVLGIFRNSSRAEAWPGSAGQRPQDSTGGVIEIIFTGVPRAWLANRRLKAGNCPDAVAPMIAQTPHAPFTILRVHRVPGTSGSTPGYAKCIVIYIFQGINYARDSRYISNIALWLMLSGIYFITGQRSDGAYRAVVRRLDGVVHRVNQY
jgi:hypothetical protein